MSLRADRPTSSRPRPAGLDLLRAPHARRGGFFSWTVVESLGDPPDLPHLGAVGVSGDRGRAMGRLSDALRNSPSGAFGLLHKIALNLSMDGYCYDDLLAARVHPDSGAVVTSEHEPSGRRAPSNNVFAEVMRVAGVQPTASGAGAS